MRTRKKSTTARDVALDVLLGVENKKANVSDLLNDAFERCRIPPAERAMATEIAFGVIRRKLTLDSIIAHLSHTEFQRLHPTLVCILRISLYQMLHLDKVPDYAAVNEAVKQTQKRLHTGAGSFANALLRKFISSGKHVPYPSPEEDLAGYLSINYSHPRWLAERWVSQFGRETTESVFRIDNLPPPLFVRASRLKISASELADELARENVSAQVCDERLGGLRLDFSGKVSSLKAFKRGYFYVQDITAMRAAPTLAPAPGECVLDLCGAPGGKATHAAELMDNRGLVISVDKSREKIRLLEENIARLGTAIIQPLVADVAGISRLFPSEF